MSKPQVRISEQDKLIIDRLQDLCGFPSQAAVIESALMFLGWAATQRFNGLSIASVDESHQRYNEVHLPALEKAWLAGQAAKSEPTAPELKIAVKPRAHAL